MADLNMWAVTGRLTRDAEYKTTASGKQLLSCGIAVNTGWGDYKKTTFAKVNQWGERGANLCGYLKKGQQIAVAGTLTLDAWQGRDGKEHTELVIDAQAIQLLGSAVDKQRPGDKTSSSRQPKSEEEELDAVPF